MTDTAHMNAKRLPSTGDEQANGFPVNVLSDSAKLALDDVVRGVEARRIAMQALTRKTSEFRRNGWQIVGPLAFSTIKGGRAEGIKIPLDTMLKLRNRWLATTDEELEPILRDMRAGLAHWIPANIKAIVDG